MDYRMQASRIPYPSPLTWRRDRKSRNCILVPKCLLSYAMFGISLPSPKTWTIICNFWNIFFFSKNMEYHKQFQEFISLFQKRGLSYAIFGISFPSPETWTFICNLLEFLYLLKKCGLSYVIY